MNYYDSIARGYDELYGAEQREKLERIVNLLEKRDLRVEPSWSLLDVGCGTGISTTFFDCALRVGVDPSKELLRIARLKYSSQSHTVFVLGSAEDLLTGDILSRALRKLGHPDDLSDHAGLSDFGDSCFDMVLSLTAIQNFSDVCKGLKNILRVGKRFVLSVLKGSKNEQIVREFLLGQGFEEWNIGKDVVFIRF
jgi:ubiquinone/menaquinone biosynthesis C-methylase UbiE